MLIHFNPATPHFFTFACPHTMAVAVVDRDTETLHPAAAAHLGTITAAHISTITSEMTRLCGEAFNPKLAPATVNLPEWIVFYQGEKLLVMHTASPAFLCPMTPDLRVIKPIHDNPPIPSAEVDAWVAKAQQALDEMKPALMAI